ncbi:AAA family ATPase [Streptomyces sp. NPDC002122]|uniref:helix-turn-helix transcriptional regulator n=1 Tax=Streptomyces sp. NPDC002122 TaxID=3154407 RepID=UPI00331DBC65
MHPRAPHLVGRDAEMAQLERALDTARGQRGSTVFLVGDGGVGKSRLAAEATGRAFSAGMRVLRGRGSTIGPMVPFRPLTEALMSLFRGGRPWDEAELGAYRPVLGRLIPDWAGEAQTGGSLVVLAEAVLRLLSVVAREHGALVVLEDLHDADTETLVVLEYLVDNLEHLPVVLLATTRAEPCAALDLAHSVTQRRSGVLLGLGPLDRSEVARMIASCLDTEAERVPGELVARLWDTSVGNPFVVEELLHGMIGNGSVAHRDGSWEVVGPLRTEVPSTLVRGIAHRTDRLGPQGRMLLSAAAVLGRRFPLPVLQRMSGIDDHGLLSHLHAGVAAQLVVPDEPAPDWYAFRHPLTAEALLAQLTPTDRAKLSGRAAEVVEELHPGLPGEWCALVAALRRDAGHPVGAARLFTEAGRRALADGAVGSGVSLLLGADELLAKHQDGVARAEVLEPLLPALAESGEFDRAFGLAEGLHELVGAGVEAGRLAALHTRLAKVAHLAGRWADGNAQIAEARALLRNERDPAQAAAVDVVAAYLALDTPGPDRTETAEKLARTAVTAAEAGPQPAVACQAWELLGVLARERDLDEARMCFERARRIAEQHRLPIPRTYALVRIGGNEWLADGETRSLELARDEALRLGAVTIAYSIDAILVLQAVLRGRFEEAVRLGDEISTTAARLRLAPVARYVLMTRATMAAHQGDRASMEEALREFSGWDGAGSQEEPLCIGLARAFCALLEENRPLALRELEKARAQERDSPTTFHLSGLHGLRLLLDVLAGEADWDHYHRTAATSASRMRWNRQFVLLAHAVLLGRSGEASAAASAVAEAEVLAAPYPTALHLGLRLTAEAALENGWGDPATWLRRAEEHFHAASVPDVAGACRALLRQFGVSVRQRRSGADRIPAQLRALGVTVREYEVFQLLAERLSNKAIAGRLYISPRTVEKHVAALVTKTARPDREALCDLSASDAATRPPR